MNGGENLNMQNVIEDLKKSIQEKRSEFCQLETCKDVEKELRLKTHKETLNHLNGHIGIFNQMTEKSKISMHLGKGGVFSGTKEDINEGNLLTLKSIDTDGTVIAVFSCMKIGANFQIF